MLKHYFIVLLRSAPRLRRPFRPVWVDAALTGEPRDTRVGLVFCRFSQRAIFSVLPSKGERPAVIHSTMASIFQNADIATSPRQRDIPSPERRPEPKATAINF